MTTVTATVSACLASIGVHPERYNNIQNGKPFPTLTVCPDDDELRQLCSGKAIWSTMGLQLAHDDSSELVTSLHQYDFVCLKPNNGNKVSVMDLIMIDRVIHFPTHLTNASTPYS